MVLEELSLMWDDHHSILVGVFGKLLESNTLVDCMIAAEGQYMKAHKVVLSACSPYFELLFTQESEMYPIIVLKDIKFQELKSIIDFVYCGKVNIPEDRLEDFVAAAESLQIKGLGGCKENVSNKKKINFPSIHKRVHVSPVPQKCVRRRPINSQENTGSLSSFFDVDNQSNNCDSVPQNELLDVTTSLPTVVSVSKTNTSSSAFVCEVSVKEESDGIGTKASISYEQHAGSSLPLAEAGVSLPHEFLMKCKPETITEIFLPETECLLEPKIELCVEEQPSLDCDNGTNPVKSDGLCQQNTSQFSGGRARRRRRWRRRPPGVDAGFACAHCGKVFVDSYKLERHVRVHTGEQPFQCSVCGRAFSQKSSMSEHQRLHSGELPFPCGVCGKAFASRSYVRKHARNVHDRCERQDTEGGN